MTQIIIYVPVEHVHKGGTMRYLASLLIVLMTNVALAGVTVKDGQLYEERQVDINQITLEIENLKIHLNEHQGLVDSYQAQIDEKYKQLKEFEGLGVEVPVEIPEKYKN